MVFTLMALPARPTESAQGMTPFVSPSGAVVVPLVPYPYDALGAIAA
jgi:hypothetical protein